MGQRSKSEGSGGAGSFTAEGGFTHSRVGVFIFKTEHEEELVQSDPPLGSGDALLGSPTFCLCGFYS